jgi:BlaI family transcriptional regulator, penicillinase repressor
MNIISRENRGGLPSPRRSLLDLAPLELDCMTTLWPMGEGTVREIRDQLAPRLPRAYTTIMTIMDRLARKGVVERRKVGRAYRYRPNLSAAEAREHALGQVVESFFGGSKEAVIEQLGLGIASGRAVMAAAAAGSRPALRESLRPAISATVAPVITGIHLAPPPSRLKPAAIGEAPQESATLEVPEAPLASVAPDAEPVREEAEQIERSSGKESTSVPMDPTLL